MDAGASGALRNQIDSFSGWYETPAFAVASQARRPGQPGTDSRRARDLKKQERGQKDYRRHRLFAYFGLGPAPAGAPRTAEAALEAPALFLGLIGLGLNYLFI